MKKKANWKLRLLILVLVPILGLCWFFFVQPVGLYSMTSPDNQHTIAIYWAGIPLQSLSYLQGSDRAYYPGYVVLWEKDHFFPKNITRLPNLLFDGIEWTSNSVELSLWAPEPPIIWEW